MPAPEVIPQRYGPHVPLDRLTPHPANPNESDLGLLCDLVDADGFAGAVLAQESTGLLIDGEHRWRTALEKGMTGLPVLWLDVDDDQRDRLLASLNESTRRGRNDESKLVALLKGLAGTERGLEGSAFDGDDLDALIAGLEGEQGGGGRPTDGDPDSIPNPPAEPVSRPGDVWALGPHRVACGDSADADLWDAILKGDRPSLVFTDPPYGIAYKAVRGSEAIANDGDAATALQVTRDALALFHDAQAHFVCCDWRSLGTIIGAMHAAAIEPKACIVWDKQVRVQNLDRYAKQHEFIVYAGPFGGQPTLCTDVWAHSRDYEPDHPTPKPVSLIEQALTTASEPGAIVADPFGGSGSTLIAAHRTGRVARLCELDPKYTDVIIQRWVDRTGQAATREDGSPWPGLEPERG